MATPPIPLSGFLQENALTLLCFSDKYHSVVKASVPVELFSSYLYRDIASRAHSYIELFNAPPKIHLPDLLEDLLKDKGEKGQAVETLLLNLKQLADGMHEEYILSQLDTFVRHQSLRLGIIEAADALERNDLGAAEERIRSSLKTQDANFHPGSTLDDVYARIGSKDEAQDKMLFGIPELDRYGYGPTRKELLLIQAPVKRGKTWCLIHLAKQGLLQKWKVLYITLEVSADLIGKRTLQSIFSLTKSTVSNVTLPVLENDESGKLVSISKKTIPNWQSLESKTDFRALRTKLSKLRQRDNLLIKEFPTRQLTVDGLVGYLDTLEALHKFIPDLLIIDYPDLMRVDVNNLRLSLGALYADIRGIAVQRNFAIAAASQVNREGTQAKLSTEVHVAEDYSKMAIADTVLTYNQTNSERELQICRLFVAAGRNDKSRYQVIVSQAYEIGQFHLASNMLHNQNEYDNLLAQHSGKQPSLKREDD